ncbi:single-stranded DNA-binding protein [Salinisphaera sp.]|uniref:single-stranded DNA-binding protein n=1 Tax=Salinisphaera sp. TaxID=1914330 RepID=UPI000C3C0597|nr:single-stranded DNA-binding protein [Salinisphaera sp.]MAS10530.1 DNA-binding protein [Salinisphaera sp.]|tara:strand:- start:953 stop:1246 length:294 start_codon:yes stop_codon:yes gene_type:complete
MFKIEFHEDRARTKEGTSAKTGKPYKIREQQGFIYLNGEPYPQKFTLPLHDDQAPYPAGTYELTPDFFLGNFGDLRVGMRNAIVESVDDKKPKAVNG